MPAPGDLVSWWSGDGYAADIAGTNSGVLQGGASADAVGVVGAAFSFDGTNGLVQIPDSLSLRPTNFTLECWVRFASLDSPGSGGAPAGVQYIIFKQNSRSSFFEGFDLGKTRIAGGDVFKFIVTSAAGQGVSLQSATMVSTGLWYHVAGVRGSNFIRLYVNGALEAQANVGFAQDYGSHPLYFGTSGQSYWDRKFAGSLDEVSLYNRALGPGEIAAIYAAGAAGKCKAPNITSQPQSQTVMVSSNATFSVAATGFGTLRYQWRFNSSPIPGATTADLTLVNVQPSAAGSYSVVVSNALGSVTSSNAVLTVLPPPCASPPPGLIGWWKGEGNGSDFVSGNTAALVNGVGFTNGMVGQAFDFNGVDGRVTVADAPALDVGTNDFTIETWVRPLVSSTDFGVMSLVSKRLAPDITHSLGYDFHLLNGQVSLRLSTSISGDGQNFGPAGLDLRDGEFHHVAVSLVRNSPTGGRFYVDGQEVLTFDPTGQNASLTVSEPLRIGNHATPSLNCFFKGQIDEVSLYARALAASEVQGIYSAGRSGKCAVPIAPTILVQPTNCVATAGDNVSFSVLAAGTQPLSYQWRFNGTNLTTATGSSLKLTDVQLSAAGSYSCLVTNAGGSATSSNALLTVLPPPPCTPVPAGAVGWWPAENSVLDAAGGNHGTVAGYGTFGYAPGFVGQAFVFDGIHRDRVDVGNPANLHLQQFTIEAWVKRASATEISLDDNNQDGAVTGEGGIVFGYGRNGYGFGLLNNGRLILSRIDVDGIQSTSAIVDTNWHHILVIKGAGAALFFIDGTMASSPIPYATTYTFETSAAIGSRGDARGGTFWGMIDEPAVYDHALSTAEILALYAAGVGGKCALPPGVLTQPISQTTPLGLSANFNVVGNGTPPLGYQWLFNGVGLTNDARITGATSNLLSISSVTPTDAGSYSVLIANAAGSVTSSNALLSVTPLLITLQPSNTTAILGSNVTFHAAVAGATPLFYQWQKDGQDLADGARIFGAQSNILAITGAETNDAGAYQLVVTNAYGAVTSQLALLTVLVPPAFVLSPSNQSWIVSSSATLYSLATGTEALSYQWYRGATRLADDARLSGTASNILSISNVVTSDAGNYTVVASNAAGLATSAVAVVAVVVPPGFTTQPRGWSVPVGMPVQLSAFASGTAPLRYQWRLNGTDVPGATSNVLSFAALTPADFGNYQLVVTNLGGGATSAVAQLTRGPVAIWGYYSIAASVPIWPAPGLSNVIAVAGGSGYSLALRGDGTLYAWGNTTISNYANSLSGIVGIAAGDSHALAVRSDGTVVAWGSNFYGETNVPAGLSSVVAVTAGAYHSAALRADGTVVAWGGSPRSGSTSVPPGLIDVSAIDANGAQTLALREDGTTVGWGGTSWPTPVPPYLHGVGGIAAGYSYSSLSLAVLTNGSLAAWNGLGWATNAPADLTNLAAVAVAGATDQGAAPQTGAGLALRSNGTVVAWGSSIGGITNVPPGLSNAVAIAGGFTHALALENEGAPLIIRPPAGGTFYPGAALRLKAKALGVAPLSFQWFKDGNPVADATNETLAVSSAQPTDAGSYQLVVSNALGLAQSIAVPVTIVDSPPVFRSQPAAGLAFLGSPWSLGASVIGSGPMQLTWTRDLSPIATGTDELRYDSGLPEHTGLYYLVASNSFGKVNSSPTQIIYSRVASWGNGPSATNAPFVPGTVLGVASGYFHALAIQPDRTVIGWGNTSYGATVPPPGLSNVVAISAGSYFSVALKGDGTVAAWGLGSSGQTNVPVNLSNAVAIAAGASHTLALRADGTVAAWGSASSFGTNVPAGLSNVVAVAAGNAHSMALRHDGSVALWGAYGKPPSCTNVVAISAGYNQCLVLQADGTVINWATSGGTIPQPANLSNVVAISAGGGWQGYLHSVALRADGTLVAWGNNNYAGQLMVPPDLVSATAISAGGGSTLAYLNDRSPVFTVQPWSRTVASGTNVTLRALTVGQPSMRYQWYANGQALAGATNNTLSFTSTHPAQSGAYQLVAINDLGAATSAVATLTVTVPGVRLTPLGLAANGFRFSFTSLPAVLYIVEFKNDLALGTWTELERRFGIGGLEIVTDVSAGGAARFYRVRALYAPSPSLDAMTWTNGAASFSFATVPGAIYVIHYKERLEDALWLELFRQTGTGAPIVVSDPNPAGPTRFYRVQVK
jgi:alpha-tubulin suppressor-like RCC1 family protein